MATSCLQGTQGQCTDQTGTVTHQQEATFDLWTGGWFWWRMRWCYTNGSNHSPELMKLMINDQPSSDYHMFLLMRMYKITDITRHLYFSYRQGSHLKMYRLEKCAECNMMKLSCKRLVSGNGGNSLYFENASTAPSVWPPLRHFRW